MAGEIHELDLVRALRAIPESLRGWQTETQTVKCRSCHAVSVFAAGRVGQNCEFCGSPELVDYEELKSPLRPQSLMPFQVDKAKVRRLIKGFYASKWLAPGALRKSAAIENVRGVYIPYWTFDARVDCPWTADSGTYYYTTETYRDSDGTTKQRQVRHTRWRPASGRVREFFDDEPVPGTQGVDPKLLRQIEPFPNQELVAYDTAYLSGFIVEHYQVVLLDAARQARSSIESKLRRLCGSEVPGDTHRNLVINPTYRDQTFKHILVPVWLLSYNFKGTSYQVLANGFTGALAGRYPKSRWKIFFLVLFAALALGAFALFAG